MRDIETLRQLQSLPLDMKVALTKDRIREWIDHYGTDQVYVTYSGGKDSTVLLHIVRSLYPEVKAVYVDTGLEYPEIRQHVQQTDNVDIIRPSMRFDQVILKYGYPVIGKEVATTVYYWYRTHNERYRIRLEGRLLDAEGKKSPYNCAKYKPLMDVDFRISPECCAVMKKTPIKRYGKNKFALTGEMASESRLRTQKWLQYGCNAFELKKPKSRPLSFWTESDILEYAYTRNIKLCSVYGNIQNINNSYCTTGCQRTGCIYCAFGLHLEKGETRFQRLKRTHPRQYEYCIGGGAYDSDGLWKPDKKGLGMKHVFDTLNGIYGADFIRYD